MKEENLGATAPKNYRNVKKSDIIAAVAKKAKTSKKAATEVVNTYWEVIKNALKNDKRANITIPNVGSIRCVTQKARTYSTKGLKNTSKKSVKKGAKTTAKFYISGNFLTKSAVKSTGGKKRKKTSPSTTKKSSTKKQTSKSRSTKKKTTKKTTKKK
ncbi:MAG: HU family DNA-binding protein [Bacteroidales bacterium]|nr:HU family DNA-binding protein [Bacteroidales bacterium]